ncbi:hypothetical protein [Wolbachia endosymbiont of Mansonella perstans]|uniref:hypothetical protein n=1 Tax=Wolbachia endosymbiont of Mansonella perstans TaxID=229526 RepID=UPI001CE17563|nr:hypothetical protein [Wolbachia endosymbiont of Mansonella perstans]MCA4773992.1 hypothetical protein [Wolbachia endosymbiont of Mansonella perstans]
MLGTLKKLKSNERDPNEQLYNTIHAKVTKKTHNRKSPKKGDLDKCIEFFKRGADPNVLSELEKSLIEQEEYQKYYKYYIENFLPALKDKVMKSEELAVPTVFNNEAEQSQRPQTRRGKILGIILNTISRSNYQIDLRNSRIDGQDEAGTPKFSDDLKPPVPSKKNSPSPLSRSVSSVSSSVGGNDNLQKEEIEQPEQDPEENPKKQENKNSGSQAYQVKEESTKVPLQHVIVAKEEPKISVSAIPGTNKNTRDSMKPENKKNGKNVIAIAQKSSANENNSEDTLPEKQPNNRNFCIALSTGCAFSAIGCLITGVVTLEMVGTGLLVMSIVFAIVAAVTRYLLPPSSKLTPTDLSPLIDDSKQR